ncbi:MAG: hypothetical protein ACP5OB_07975, partial [Candidatus Ratteibacteria bacterium]
MISRIKKFTIFFVGDETKLLDKLQKLGIVEIENTSLEGFENQKILKDEIEEKIKKIEFLRKILFEREKMGEKIYIDEKKENEILNNFSLEGIYNYFLKIYQEIEKRKKIIQKIEKIKDELNPLLDTQITFSELFTLLHFDFLVFSLPHKKEIKKDIEDLYIEKIGENKKEALYLILFRKRKKEIAENFIKEIGGRTVFVRKWNKPIKIIFEKLEKNERKNEEKILNLTNKISEILNYKLE